MAFNAISKDDLQAATTQDNPLEGMFDFESFHTTKDAVFDRALEDSILECLGNVLAVCFNSSRRENLEYDEVERVMIEGNQIYDNLHNLCFDQRDLFFKVYNTAKAYKGKGLVPHNCLLSYEEAVKRAEGAPNQETLCHGIQFIHDFQSLVRQRLLLVKPLLVNQHETKQVFDTVTHFMCYECIFDSCYV